jgi:hypothetical protein
MPDEPLSQPLPLPRPRRTLTTLLVALLAFALGGLVVGWLIDSGKLPFSLTKTAPAKPDRRIATPPAAVRLTTPTGPASQGIQLSPLGAFETRLALLEGRLSRIDGEANAASGSAARAEALLVAYAARRRLDKGEPLGFIEDQLRLRFGGTQPKAVETVIAAARNPVTLDALAGQLDASAPVLSGEVREESTWARARRELADLFVVRRSPITVSTPTSRLARARIMLASGKIDEAVTEVERLPGADGAQAWIAAARRYEATQRALEVIETAAMLEPRALRDGSGQLVDQPSPLARPTEAAPVNDAPATGSF